MAAPKRPRAKHAGGRPTRYSPTIHPSFVYELARTGKTDKEMAKILGVAVSTFYNWRDRYPEFLESIEKGKVDPDDEVENALRQRALGYEHPEEKIFYDTKTGKVIRVMTIKHYPPDTGAAAFWLKNRRPETWREKQEIEHSAKEGPIIQILAPDNGRGPKPEEA